MVFAASQSFGPAGAGEGEQEDMKTLQRATAITWGVLASGVVLVAGCGGSDTEPRPTMSLALSATRVMAGEAVTLSWQSRHASQCVGTQGIVGMQPPEGSMRLMPQAPGDVAYAMSCSGEGGEVSDVVSLTVDAPERWPSYTVTAQVLDALHDQLEGPSGRFHDPSYVSFLQDYKPFGDYLNYGVWRKFTNDGEVVISPSGLPQVRDGDKLYWNTVTLSHFGLTMYGRVLAGDESARQPFFAAVEKMLELQAPTGGFPYPSRQHRQTTLPDGWVSAMAQGNALSVFARALRLKNDERYRRAGDLAFANLMTPVEQGGARTSLATLDPSLARYIFFPEYPAQPIDYTLNGYMYALLGVYDWSSTESASRARAAEAFGQGMRTLEKLLPLHDVQGYSTYDLAHLVLKVPPYVAPDYLGIHVHLLHALNSVAPSPVLQRYERQWAAKIDAMNALLKFTTIAMDDHDVRVGQPVAIRLESAGGQGGVKLYSLAVKFKNEWTTVVPYAPASRFSWTPQEPGEYDLGFFVKDQGSAREWDNFRYRTVVVR